MKKLILILTLAAFACSPLITTQAQAAQGHSISAQCGKKHHGKHHGKHKGKHKGKKHNK
jgi:hypothetical protein